MELRWQLATLFFSFFLSWDLGYSKERLTAGVILPDNTFFRRPYMGAITKTTRQLPRSTLTYNYDVSGMALWADQYSPTELLNFFCRRILSQNMNAIMYMSNSDYEGEFTSAGQFILQVSNNLGIPVIAWNGDNSAVFQPTTESIILQMAPSIEHQCRAMLALLKRYNWKAFSIVTGSMAGEVHFVNNLRELAEKSDVHFEIMSVVHMPKPNERMIREQLKKLELTETRVILLYSSRDEAKLILAIAKLMGLMRREFVWVLSQSIVGDIEKMKPKEFPIGLFGIYFKSDREVMKTAIENSIRVWAHGMNALLEDIPNHARLANVSLQPNMDCTAGNMHWKNGRILYDYMRNITIEGQGHDDRTISFNEDGIITDTELKIVNINPEHEWEQIGQWNMRDGLQIDDITWPGDMPTPPKGRPSKYHLKVVTIKESPYIIYSDPDPKTGQCPVQAALCRVAPVNETMNVPNATANPNLYQCCSGLCIDLLKILSEKISFEYDLFQVEDKKFGAFDKEKGEWNGLVRSLMDGKADMSMASLSITEERNQQIDFSVPFLETGITIIVAVRDGVISPTAFLEPYDYPSWCLILVFSVHASGAAIFIYEWLSPSGLDRGNKPIREHRFSLFRSFWLIWAMLFGAAVNTDNPRGVSSRFMGNIWALFAVVFTASYTANLAAFMITKEDYDRLSGIQDWRLMNPYSHKPPFKFATVPHGSTEANLRNNYADMHRYMRKYNKTTVLEGVRAVKEHEINAFIYDATVLEYLAGHDDRCKLRTVGNWYAMTGYGLGFPHGSKWLQVINKYIIELQHNGEMERLQKFWLSGACSQRTEEGESSMPLGILNFTSAFILLAGGMLLGGVLLLLEHIYFKFFRRKLRKWDTCGCCGLVSLSMGKSLTFEQSVREAIDMSRHHKCKNPMCETHLWKAKHELDLALLRINRLQKAAGNEAVGNKDPTKPKDATKLKKMGTKNLLCPVTTSQPGAAAPGIGWHPDINEPPWPPEDIHIGPPLDLPIGPALGPPLGPHLGCPPDAGWRPEVIGPPEIPGAPWPPESNQYPVGPAPDYQAATAADGQFGANLSYPVPPPPLTPVSPVVSPPEPIPAKDSLEPAASSSSARGFRSLPTSPVKSPKDPVYHNMSGSGTFDDLKSGPTSHNSDNNLPSGLKTRHHKGNVYTEVPDGNGFEKETVL